MSADALRIGRNMAHLCVRFVVSTAVGMLCVRILLQRLGVEDYGIYAAVFSVVTLFGTLNGTFENAARRFISYEMPVGGAGRVAQIFSAVLLLAYGFSLLVLALGETGGIWFARNRLDIPPGATGIMEVVFHTSLAVMALQFIQIPYSALITSGERMRFYSKFSLVEASTGLAAAYLSYRGLGAYAVSLLLLALLYCSVHILYCRKWFPHVRFASSVRMKDVACIGRFVSWGTLGAVGNVLKYQGTNIILNICAGVAFNASWRISIGVWGFLYGLCMSFRQASSPVVFAAYAERPARDFMRLVRMTVLVSLFLAAVSAALLFMHVDGFLLFWLGEHSAPQLAMFVQCALVNFVFDAVSCPLTLAIDATGRVARYQIVTSILSLVAFLLAWGLLLLGFPEWSALGAVALCNGVACAYRFFHLRTLVMQ